MASATRAAKPLRARKCCQWWRTIIHRLPQRLRRSHGRVRRSRATPAADGKPARLDNDASPLAKPRTTARVGLDELNEISCKLFEPQPVASIKGILKRPLLPGNTDRASSSWFKYCLGPPASGWEVSEQALGRELIQLESELRREQAWNAELLRRLAMCDKEKWEYGAACAAAKVPAKCRWPPRYVAPERKSVQARLGRSALDWWFK